MEIPDIEGKKYWEEFVRDAAAADEHYIKVKQNGDEVEIYYSYTDAYSRKTGITEFKGKIVAVDPERKLVKIKTPERWYIYDFQNMKLGFLTLDTKILFFDCHKCKINDEVAKELVRLLEISLKVIDGKDIKFELYPTGKENRPYQTNEVDGYQVGFDAYNTEYSGEDIRAALWVPDNEMLYIEAGLNNNLTNGFVHPYMISHDLTDKVFDEIKKYLETSDLFKFREIFTVR